MRVQSQVRGRGLRNHPGPGEYTSVQVCNVAGLTYRQLDYAVARQYGRNQGTGNFRTFTASEVFSLACFSELLHFGIRSGQAWTLLNDPATVTGNEVIVLSFNWTPVFERVTRELAEIDAS